VSIIQREVKYCGSLLSNNSGTEVKPAYLRFRTISLEINWVCHVAITLSAFLRELLSFTATPTEFTSFLFGLPPCDDICVARKLRYYVITGLKNTTL